jgi:hypothetical protein
VLVDRIFDQDRFARLPQEWYLLGDVPEGQPDRLVGRPVAEPSPVAGGPTQVYMDVNECVPGDVRVTVTIDGEVADTSTHPVPCAEPVELSYTVHR